MNSKRYGSDPADIRIRINPENRIWIRDQILTLTELRYQSALVYLCMYVCMYVFNITGPESHCRVTTGYQQNSVNQGLKTILN